MMMMMMMVVGVIDGNFDGGNYDDDDFTPDHVPELLLVDMEVVGFVVSLEKLHSGGLTSCR